MFHRGQLLIGLIFLVALLSACFSWFHQYQQGRQALEFWSSENAMLIRHAPGVQLLKLSPPKGPADGETRDLLTGSNFTIVTTLDITEARGLVHARQALIEDASFHWDSPRGDCAQQWDYALRFDDGDLQAVVLFDISCQRVQLLGQERDLSMAPIAKGMLVFLEEQLPTN